MTDDEWCLSIGKRIRFFYVSLDSEVEIYNLVSSLFNLLEPFFFLNLLKNTLDLILTSCLLDLSLV